MRIRKPSPAMVVATLALVLAVSGTTLAAGRYLITSPSQIKPSVLRSLASSARGEVNEVHSAWALSKPGLGFVWAHAQCPNGTHIVSGGYESSLAPGMSVQFDEPTGNGWSALAAGSGAAASSEQSRLRVHAFCASGAP
ncbi:MAG TPA: hypothetical protein VNV44_08060 [Solirubrobacteraceae bacterium]|jgi:hypothetical protein|nr:hypothetical protein [Solirubrobacteraceae bacterium]